MALEIEQEGGILVSAFYGTNERFSAIPISVVSDYSGEDTSTSSHAASGENVGGTDFFLLSGQSNMVRAQILRILAPLLLLVLFYWYVAHQYEMYPQ